METDSVEIGGNDDPRAIVIPVDRSLADIRDAYTWIRWHMGSWLIVILFSAAGLIAAFGFTKFGALPGLAITLVGVVLLYAAYAASLSSSAEKTKKIYSLYGPAVYTFNETGIEGRSQQMASSTAWGLWNKVIETKHNYLIVPTTKTSVLIIPKACIPSDKVEPLRALFKQKVAGRVNFRAPSTPRSFDSAR